MALSLHPSITVIGTPILRSEEWGKCQKVKLPIADSLAHITPPLQIVVPLAHSLKNEHRSTWAVVGIAAT
jgi:hypothetical protein